MRVPYAVSCLFQPRIRRIEIGPQAIQAGSTLTIHDVSTLGPPNIELARLYTFSPEDNAQTALSLKRVDHAAIFGTLADLLNDPPPPYSRHSPLRSKDDTVKGLRSRQYAMSAKKLILDKMYVISNDYADTSFTNLIAQRDFQLLAIISCILLSHEKKETVVHVDRDHDTRQSPIQDYFALPQMPSFTPIRTRSRSSIAPLSPGKPSSANTPSWSQMLNPSNTSIRAPTPRERQSVDLTQMPLDEEREDPIHTWAIPVPGKNLRRPEKSRYAQVSSESPPLASFSNNGGSKPSSHPPRPPDSLVKLSFNSASPTRRQYARSMAGLTVQPNTCIVRLDWEVEESYVSVQILLLITLDLRYYLIPIEGFYVRDLSSLTRTFYYEASFSDLEQLYYSTSS